MHVSGINDWLLNLKTVFADYYLVSLLISVCTYVHNMKMSCWFKSVKNSQQTFITLQLKSQLAILIMLW